MRTPVTLVLVFLMGWLAARGLEPTAATAAPGPADFQGVVAALDVSVVHITTSTSGARPTSRDDNVGAGFVVDPGGLIVTNRHVVGGARRIQVTVKGRGTVVAEVVASDDATDVALLRVPLTGLSPVTLGSAKTLRVGQWILAAGSPYGLAHSWSVGVVSGLGRTGVGVNPRGYEDYIQTDAAANLGNSGGPLVDAEGRVVGMVTAILSRATGHQGVTLAVPIDVVASALARMQGGGGARPSLGVRVREVRGGLRITQFDPGSPASTAGLKLGDVIISVGNTVVRRSADLQRAVWSSEGSVRVAFMRGNRTLSAVVPLR